MRVYVASSWRNEYQQNVVAILRDVGHEVYDFRNPRVGDEGFHWSEIDPEWKQWSPGQYCHAVRHPIATAGFASDYEAMQWAEALVLLQPSGRSAHLEAGWAAGAGKHTAMLVLEPMEPELMVLMFDALCLSMNDLLAWLARCAE